MAPPRQQKQQQEQPPVTTTDHAHFAAIPWCAQHLRGPRVRAATPLDRTPKPANEDTLFAGTLKYTPGTITAILQIYDEPEEPGARVDAVKCLATLGSGMNGHPNVLHGGIVATLLDEVIGLLIPINRGRGTIGRGSSSAYMTAFLNTTYVRPVPTPSTVLVRANFVKVEGRKLFAEGTIEDEHGVVLARGTALYVEIWKAAL
ncbi:thioesterase superfamily protein [Xylariomycetidae sp. FL2044]|nr:thioesterase superfamily protein [Xylariomycetidae sp. FL2044]